MKFKTVMVLKWWVSPCQLAELHRVAGRYFPYYHEVIPPLIEVPKSGRVKIPGRR